MAVEFWNRGRWRLGYDARLGWHILHNMLQHIRINDNEDYLIWRQDRSGNFLVKSLCDFLNDSGIRSKHVVYVWKTKCPLKIKLFFWMVDKNTILT